MTASDLSGLAVGLWCIPLALLGGMLGLAFLLHYWRQSAQVEIKELQAELRWSETEVRQLAARLQDYSPSDPEPYGSQVAGLQNLLTDLQHNLLAQRMVYVHLQEQLHRPSALGWRGFPRSVGEQYTLRREIAALQQDLAALRHPISQLVQGARAIELLAWQTALEIRLVRDLHIKSSRALERLRAHAAYGSTLDGAETRVRQAGQELAHIPAYFLSDPEESVVAQADRGSVIAVHYIAGEHRPGLEAIAAQAQDWEKGFSRAVEQVSQLRGGLAALESGLTATPALLLVDDWRQEFAAFAVIANTLHTTLSHLDVDSLPGLIEQTDKLQQAVNVMQENLLLARRQLLDFEETLPELQENLKALSAQFSTLGTQSIHPIVWDQSSPRLTRISQQVGAIGSLRKPRPPAQLAQDLTGAARLNQECRELAVHCQQIAQQHAQLLDLLASPDLEKGMHWYESARQLTGRVQAYDPENWPRQDQVANLSSELETLRDGLESLSAGAVSTPVPESQLALSLEDVRYLKDNQEALRTRLTNVESRLSEIVLIESHSRELLDRADVVLNLLESLQRSNRYLDGLAARETPRLRSALLSQQDELDQPARGTVDKKAQQVKATIARIEQQANQWLAQFDKEIQSKLTVLSAALVALDQVARLDDAAVAQARSLVVSGGAYLAGSHQTPWAGMHDLGLEFKRRCEMWEKLEAGARALAGVDQHVLDMSRQASSHRQAVQQQLEQASSRLKNSGSWPVSALALTDERTEFENLEKQRQALQEQPVSAIQYVTHLGNLSSRYQALEEKINRTLDRAAQEQAEFQRQEAELDEHRRLWQGLLQDYRDNNQAAEEIRELLDGLDRDLARFKQDSRQGNLPADQAEQALKKLDRRVRLAQVAIDEQHAVDMNGRVITSRDATYKEL